MPDDKTITLQRYLVLIAFMLLMIGLHHGAYGDRNYRQDEINTIMLHPRLICNMDEESTGQRIFGDIKDQLKNGSNIKADVMSNHIKEYMRG